MSQLREMLRFASRAGHLLLAGVSFHFGNGGSVMRNRLGLWLGAVVALIILAPMAAPAAAQDARALLQAADKAIGASGVNSVEYSGTSWLGALGPDSARGGIS